MAQIIVTLKQQFADNCILDGKTWARIGEILPKEWEIAGVNAQLLSASHVGGVSATGIGQARVTLEVADNDVALLYAQMLSGGKAVTATLTGGKLEVVPKRPRGRPKK